MDREERIKKHIKTKYYKNDKKVITVHVDAERDLYDTLDKNRDTINPRVTEYLERNTETLLPLSEVTINIDCPEKVDVKAFEKCIKVHYSIEILNSERIEKIGKKKKLFLVSTAVLSFAIVLLSKGLVRDLFSFLATLAIWEFCDALIFFDEQELIDAYVYDVLVDAEVK